MTYLEKEQAILAKLQSQNYAFFDGDKEEAFDFLGARLQAFPDYVNTVVRMETMMPIWRARFDAPEYQEHVQRIDTERKHCHDAAIASVDILNRVSNNLGLEPFAQVNTKDRHAVAEFVGAYVNEVYLHGINGGFDQAVYEMQKIPAEKTKPAYDRLKELDRELEKRGLNGASQSREDCSYGPC